MIFKKSQNEQDNVELAYLSDAICSKF